MIDFEEQFLAKVREMMREELARLSFAPQWGGEPRQDDFVQPDEASRVLGVKVATLAAWRTRGEGPAYSRCGRLIRYRRDDLESYLENRTVAR